MMERPTSPNSIDRISGHYEVSSHLATDYVIADECDQVLTYPTMSFVKASFDRQPDDKKKINKTRIAFKLIFPSCCCFCCCYIINQIFYAT